MEQSKYKFIGSSLRFKGKKYRNGDTFLAYPDEIPKGFRKSIQLIAGQVAEEKPQTTFVRKKKPEKTEEKPKEEKQEEPEQKEEITVERKGRWYNVFVDGEQVNKKALTKTEADELKQELETK